MANQPKKYKKFVATAATATLVASAIVPVASAASFSDVSDSNEFAKFIDALTDEGIINGYPSTNTFKPGALLTRGQVVKMLGRWVENNGVELPSDWKTKAYFKDVPTNHKDQELVKYAALVSKAGVFTGAAGNLMAEKNITRQQMAKVLNGAYAAVNGQSLIEIAEDVDNVRIPDLLNASAEYEAAIQALMDLEISSTTSGNFRPLENVTRGQFSKFLYNTINFKAVDTAKVKAINNTTVEVTFGEEVGEVKATDFKIEGLEVKNAVVKQTDKKTVVLTTAAQTSGTEYTVTVKGDTVGKFTGVSAVIPTSIDVVQKSVQGKLGQEVTLSAQVTVAEGASKAGIPVTFNIPGSTDHSIAPITAEAVTNAEGVATYSYTRYTAINDAVTAYATGDRSKFSTGYVFWGVDTILTLEEVTEGSSIENGSSKTYKVTYKNQETGKVVTNAALQVSFLENINVSVDKASKATVNGTTPVQYSNGSETDSVEIYTDSKGEATFTVSGQNTEVTPIVFARTTTNPEKYEASKLQVAASKVKFSALQAEYTIDIVRDGAETAATGLTNGREYTVTVKGKDGKPAKNEIVNLAFNEDLDRVIGTTTSAQFIDEDQENWLGDSTTVKTNDKGEATFIIGTATGNVKEYATPIAWIDVNNSNANNGKLDEGEPSKVAPISYFTAEKLTAGKLVSKDNSTSASKTKFDGDDTARFEFELTNQSGKKIALNATDYETVEVTYTVKNTGKNDIRVSGHSDLISPNRSATVTVKATGSIPTITVTPDTDSTTSVEVTATAVLTDTSYSGDALRPFTVGRTSASAVTFTKATEVPATYTGLITGYDESAKTFTFANKDAVEYAGQSGKTYVFKGQGGTTIADATAFLDLVKANDVTATYKVDGDTITFEIINIASGGAASTEVAKLNKVATTKAAGTYKDGTVEIELTFDKNVDVTGTPELALNVGGTTATYTSGTGTKTLKFTYTVTSGDDTAASDLTVSAVNLAGGTIKTTASTNAATLTLATPVSFTGVKIDAKAPIAHATTPIAVANGTGTASTIDAGDKITIKFSEAVDTTKVILANLTPSGTAGDTFGAGATVTPVGAVGGYADTFEIVLGTTPQLTATTGVITITAANVVDKAGNAAGANVTFTIPAATGF